jgi:hypothetical protein
MCHEDVGLNKHEAAEDFAVVLDLLEKDVLKVEVIEDLRGLNGHLISCAVLYAACQLFSINDLVKPNKSLIKGKADLSCLNGVIDILHTRVFPDHLLFVIFLGTVMLKG